MSSQTISSVNVIDRMVFDSLSDEQKQENIYFVREGTSETNTMLSLYYENSKQCDILDISDSFVSPESIPDKYKISGKMLLTKNEQDTFYQGFMWDGTKFINCLGTVNNVIVCDGLPNIFGAVKNFVYIDISSNGIFVFDGYNYQDIISSNTYATNQYLNQLYYELVDMINNIQPSGSNMIGSAVTVLRGAMLADIGNLTYEELPSTIPIVEGGWSDGVGTKIYPMPPNIPNNRCRSDKIYRIPSGKTATISTTASNIQAYYRTCTDNRVITGQYGWYNFPVVIDNSNSVSDIYIAFTFHASDDTTITPSDVGVVTSELS